MSDDEQPPAWFTESQRGTFKIGDEVVVTLHGECHRGVKHGDQEIGIRGIVVATDDPGDHPIRVYFRHPLPLTRSYLRASSYTAGELKPFDMAELMRAVFGDDACRAAGRQHQDAPSVEDVVK